MAWRFFSKASLGTILFLCACTSEQTSNPCGYSDAKRESSTGKIAVSYDVCQFIESARPKTILEEISYAVRHARREDPPAQPYSKHISILAIFDPASNSTVKVAESDNLSQGGPGHYALWAPPNTSGSFFVTQKISQPTGPFMRRFYILNAANAKLDPLPDIDREASEAGLIAGGVYPFPLSRKLILVALKKGESHPRHLFLREENASYSEIDTLFMVDHTTKSEFYYRNEKGENIIFDVPTGNKRIASVSAPIPPHPSGGSPVTHVKRRPGNSQKNPSLKVERNAIFLVSKDHEAVPLPISIP
jgi:hypothetical protein